MIRVFISYASSDEAFADKLASDLSSLGADVFYAKWKIKVGDSIVDKINAALSTHDHLVVVLSATSVKSEWVQRELNSSLMRQLRDKDIKIKPVLIQDCEIPALLSDIKYADFRDDDNKGFASLVDSLQEDFALEPYIELVNSQYPTGNLPYDKRLLAILLKRLSLLPFAMIGILYKMYEDGGFFEGDESQNDIVNTQLKGFMEEKLVFERSIDGRKSFHYTELGRVVFALIRAGLNEGLINPVCSR
ncbi:MAG: toll/interleukin-1 receptor domain-containing protein [Thermodesulfobacteriota bacterium]